MVGKEIKRVSRGYHYFFVKPGRRTNAYRTAESLMDIKGVSEVAITEGEFGFVVKASESHKEERVLGRINSTVGGITRKAVCHCQYVRG